MNRTMLLGAMTLALVSAPAFGNQNRNSAAETAGITNRRDRGTHIANKNAGGTMKGKGKGKHHRRHHRKGGAMKSNSNSRD